MVNRDLSKISMNLSKRYKILIIVVIGILIIFSLNFCRKGIRNIFYLISSPVQKVIWQTGKGLSDFGKTIIETKDLKRENTDLKLKNQQLLAENSSLKELRGENEILREALEIGLEEDFKLTLAEIIGKDVSQDFILINKGSKNGIQKDFPVINQQKVLFGKIDETYKNFSKVMLISNKNSILDVKIQDSDRNNTQKIYGVVKGKGDLNVFLDLIPSDVVIKEGDILISSGLGGNLPKGLLVGEIKKKKKNDIKPFQKAEIKPFFDITQTEKLFIILK